MMALILLQPQKRWDAATPSLYLGGDRRVPDLQHRDAALDDFLGAREEAIPELPGAAAAALEIQEDARAAGAEG